MFNKLMEFSDYFLSREISLKELGFNPGAAEDKITSVEKQLDITFPTEYRDFLILSNGQTSTGMIFLPNDMLILPLHSVLLCWEKEMEMLYERHDSFIKERYEDYTCNNKARSILFHPKRIPFASDGKSCFMFIDLIPGPDGNMGQIIFNCSNYELVVLTDSLGSLFSNYTKLLKEEKLIYDPKNMRMVTSDYKMVDTLTIVDLFSGIK